MNLNKQTRAKRILISGGAGFIGSHLVDLLVSYGHKVRVLDNLSTGNIENINGHIERGTVQFIQGDIQDASLVEKSLEDVEIVVHLAAQTSVPYSIQNPRITFEVNVNGTLNMLRSCANWGIKKLVFASSSAIYGETISLPATETTMPNPISPYAESKLMGENHCFAFSDRRLLASTVLRFFNVYGPRQGLSEYAGVIMRFIENTRQGIPLRIYGDGLQTRDFVYVRDVANSILLSMENNKADNEVFNIGSGQPTRIEELANKVLELTGSKVGISYMSPRKGDIKHSYADISKAKKLLGYKPDIKLRHGLSLILE